MKLGIVIPLKSKSVSKNWNTTCGSLQRTLVSLEQQSDSQFEYIVVGHEAPDFLLGKTWNGNSIFHSIKEVPPPSKRDATQEHYTQDKNAKITKAIELLRDRDQKITMWFALDADDLVHKDLVKTVHSLNDPAGVILDNGYMYYPEQNRVISTTQLAQYCGSTGMVSDRYISQTGKVSLDNMQAIVFCRYSHMGLSKFFSDEIKQQFATPDDKLITYILAHGDNISDDYRNSIFAKFKALLKPYVKGTRPSTAFMNDFGW
ncbi:hypothetical protein KO519_05615 [Paraglaciecola agarilytica]|uniref:hypothetical protein n=1 Tax=Paraglaciecola chathamensis TaxID=368405 RepID=UPI001C09F66E|nr:hypothetical protein [Paraglaciecola agarilytica]MBU3017175.1 hypothetical protein [Paraglaciecola agarilytica]